MDRTKATVAVRRRRWGSGAAVVAMVAAGFGLGGAASALPGATEKVSVSSTGIPASGDSEGAPALSFDGRYVAFASHADNLVPGKTVHGLNVYVRDRVAGTTELVSQSSDGTPADNNDISGANPAISSDGRYVAFQSDADNLVPGDTNRVTDVFVRDRVAGTTERVSVDSAGGQASGASTNPSISGDGNLVAFQSIDENLAPGAADQNGIDVFVHDRTTGATTLVSPGTPRFGGNSVEPDISADGRFVAFVGPCELVTVGACTAQQAPQIFVRDLQAGVTKQATLGGVGAAGKNNPDISADGRFVAFDAYGTDLVPGDTDTGDVYVVDTTTNAVTRVSVDSNGNPGNDSSVSNEGPAISDDGQKVAFESSATNLVPGDTNGVRDIFVHDLSTGQTTRESVNSAGDQANAASTGAAISGDGNWVGFVSGATNLVPNDPGRIDTFVHQLSAAGTTTTTTTPPSSTTTTVATQQSAFCSALQDQLQAAQDPAVRQQLALALAASGCTAGPGTTTTTVPVTTTTVPVTTTTVPVTTTTVAPSTTTTLPSSVAQACESLRARRAVAGPEEQAVIDQALAALGCP